MTDLVLRQALLIALTAKGAQTAVELHDKLTPDGKFLTLYNELLALEQLGEVTPVAIAGEKHRLWSLAVKGGEGVLSDE